MRFKTFLEASIKPYEREDKELDELLEIIQKQCSQAVSGGRIYRGSKSHLPSGIFNPSSGKRKSANTSNYYTMLLDSNPKNAKWPKRSESFIATTHLETASNYARGTLLVLFPFNGTDIGVVNEPDLWDTKLDLGHDLKEQPQIVDMNINWTIIFEELGREVTPHNIPTMDELISYLKGADPIKLCKALQEVDLLNRRTDESEFKGIAKEFIKQIPIAYSYKSLGCDIMKPNHYTMDENSELWFSGKCVGLTFEDYKKVEDELS